MRWQSIDLLRTIAVIVMVIVHFAENLAGVTPPITGLGAPLFALLSGVSYRLWLNGRLERNVSDGEISRISVRRGLFVFSVGLAFNVLVWLPDDIGNWDVLTFIGVALLLLNLVRRLPLPVTAFTAALVILISPVLRASADYESYWIPGYFDGDFTLTDQLTGFLATGYFPIFPWIAYSLTGFVAGTRMADDATERKESSRSLILAGAALMAASAIGWTTRSLQPDILANRFLGSWSMFPPTTTYVLATLGLALCLLGGTHVTIDSVSEQSRIRRALRICESFSRHAFSIYVLHHVVHLWPLWIYGLSTGREATDYWQKAMPAWSAYSLAGLFLVLCAALLRWLDPHDRHGIESWMRRLCD